ncbi:MAG: hypothetical protein Q8L21_03085 [Candidatus Komeilibacteria bacterium]|nr:hypothetical protein [Candidatus Komeilibacteria bacterium]
MFKRVIPIGTVLVFIISLLAAVYGLAEAAKDMTLGDKPKEVSVAESGNGMIQADLINRGGALEAVFNSTPIDGTGLHVVRFAIKIGQETSETFIALSSRSIAKGERLQLKIVVIDNQTVVNTVVNGNG